MTKPKESRPKSKPILKSLWFLGGTVTIASLAVMWVSYSFLSKNGAPEDEAGFNVYQYHFAMIAENTDTSVWNDVYEGTVERAAEYGAYVEQPGEGLSVRLSVEDAINMAIYEDVDGIFLRPAEGPGIQAMIDKAVDRGIPVITMEKDIPDSRRQGFVGINDYFLGQEYGKRILKIAGGDTGLVTVLVPGASFNETSRSWFRQGLSNTVKSDAIRFDFRIIRDDKGLNNAEEVIHGMAAGYMECPDIIICLDEVITQTTYQILREWEPAKQVTVIGSSVSDTIAEGIAQGYIDSTITIDPAAMGRMSVDAMMTYKRHHMVSYYTEVNTRLIDHDSVGEYGKEEEDGGEGHREK